MHRSAYTYVHSRPLSSAERCSIDQLTTMLENGESQKARFYFPAFRFIEQQNETVSTYYLHCIIRLCEPSTCSSFKVRAEPSAGERASRPERSRRQLSLVARSAAMQQEEEECWDHRRPEGGHRPVCAHGANKDQDGVMYVLFIQIFAVIPK